MPIQRPFKEVLWIASRRCFNGPSRVSLAIEGFAVMMMMMVQAGSYKHIMNLGHGIEATTPEENAKLFVDTVKGYRYKK